MLAKTLCILTTSFQVISTYARIAPSTLSQQDNILSIVLLLPPAPAALVLLGRAFATLSFWSAAARRLMAVLGPPGGVGDDGRPMLAPEEAGAPTGDDARGED